MEITRKIMDHDRLIFLMLIKSFIVFLNILFFEKIIIIIFKKMYIVFILNCFYILIKAKMII